LIPAHNQEEVGLVKAAVKAGEGILINKKQDYKLLDKI